MDTREKIVDAQQLRQLAAAGRTLAAGFFDVLTAGEVRRLEQIAAGSRVAVAVLTKEGALLDQRARIELVAGLKCVEAVGAWDGGAMPEAAVRLDADHEQATVALIARVIERHGG